MIFHETSQKDVSAVQSTYHGIEWFRPYVASDHALRGSSFDGEKI